MSISYGGDYIQDTDGGVLRPISSVMRNRIINGDCRIDQRNAGASVTPTASGYTLDRWRYGVSSASKCTIQQNAGSVTPPVGFVNYLGLTSTSAYTVGSGEANALSQKVEGFNITDLGWGTANAKTVTLSFWIYSSLTGSFGGSFRNNAGNRSYPFSYTVNSANTWEQKVITVSGDTTGTWLTTNGSGIEVIFGIGVGSTLSGTAGAWAAADYRSATGTINVLGTSGATFYITGVQLEVGSSATGFEYRQYQQELALCQRYCYVAKDQGGTPFVGGIADSTTTALLTYNLPVQPRAVPTISFSGNVVISDQYLTDPSANPPTVVNTTINSTVNGRFRIGGYSGLVVGRFYGGAPNTTGTTTFSMEL